MYWLCQFLSVDDVIKALWRICRSQLIVKAFNDVSSSQFHQAFTNSYFNNLLLPKNTKYELKVEKSWTFVQKTTHKSGMKLAPTFQLPKQSSFCTFPARFLVQMCPSKTTCIIVHLIQPKLCCKISAQIFLKQNDIYTDIRQMLATLCFAPMGWWNRLWEIVKVLYRRTL